MNKSDQTAIDPDFFQILIAALSAFSDLATIFQVARESKSKSLAFDPDSPAVVQVKELRKEYRALFQAMDDVLHVFGRYDGTMRNVDAKHRVGFGSFLTNLSTSEFREYKELRNQINQATTKVGIWTATIIEQMPHHASAFSKAAVLNHTELNDILHGDLSYSEIVLRYRDLKDRVEIFFEGLFKRTN